MQREAFVFAASLGALFLIDLQYFFLIFRERAVKPAHLAVALKGEEVGADAVEEIAVVRDQHRATGKTQQRLFENAQGVPLKYSPPVISPHSTRFSLEQTGGTGRVFPWAVYATGA